MDSIYPLEKSLSKRRKLLQKILSGSKNVRFADLIMLVEAFGFVLRRISGSHRVYKHPNVPSLLSLQPSKDGQAKPYQLRQFLELVEEYHLTMTDTDTEDSGEED